MLEIWDLWVPDIGATGLPFCRARIESDAAGDRVLVHAAPPKLEVTVTSAEDGRVQARGADLNRGAPGPISYLVRVGQRITLEDGWPGAADLGRLVLLPGGEAGTLRAWWNADDHSEWRWSVEFYNHV
ncbi:MAG: hypothetical protein M3042_08440 [Actinomycetota bacterium]|nr:hypothetical protein [Actinomycetota bacterium]